MTILALGILYRELSSHLGEIKGEKQILVQDQGKWRDTKAVEFTFLHAKEAGPILGTIILQCYLLQW